MLCRDDRRAFAAVSEPAAVPALGLTIPPTPLIRAAEMIE
jgi:hypothetical protein